MDWNLAVAAGSLLLAVLSAWGGAAFAAGRASASAELRIAEAEQRILALVEGRLREGHGDRRAELDKIWERLERGTADQAKATAQLAGIQSTLEHIERLVNRLVDRIDTSKGGHD